MNASAKQQRRRERSRSRWLRVDGSRRRVGIGQIRGELVPTAKLTERIVLAERKLARKVRVRHGELPLGWTSERAELHGLSRSAYEKALYGQSYAHLPYALKRPVERSGWRVWNAPGGG